jgi:Zn-dependent protease
VFLEPNHTPYDLRWRMFGTDVRVHPLFWLLSAVLGWSWFSSPGGTLGYLALWVLCCFVSILLHEFGHVFAGRLFGAQGHIVLYSFGGLAVGSNPYRRWQRVLVLLAGPAAQLLLYGCLYAGLRWGRLLDHAPVTWLPHLGILCVMLLEINLYWPLLNLLPVWPLDGGQITREVCEGGWGARGTSVALGISLVVAGLFAAHFFLYAANGHRLLPPPVPEGGAYSALMFAWLAAGSYMALQAESQKRRHWDDDSPWGR